MMAALSVLATPGPTNTLLATAGAGLGFRRALPLLTAELSGYFLAIIALRVAVGPIVAAAPAFAMVLRILVVLYLIYLAAMLWHHGANEMGGAGPVPFQRVFVTTLLNPKAIIFAFALLPPIAETTMVNLLPWLLALALHIFIIGGCWIAAGASLRQGLHGYVDSKLGYRASAAVLLLLAGGIGAHAIVMA